MTAASENTPRKPAPVATRNPWIPVPWILGVIVLVLGFVNRNEAITDAEDPLFGAPTSPDPVDLDFANLLIGLGGVLLGIALMTSALCWQLARRE